MIAVTQVRLCEDVLYCAAVTSVKNKQVIFGVLSVYAFCGPNFGCLTAMKLAISSLLFPDCYVKMKILLFVLGVIICVIFDVLFMKTAYFHGVVLFLLIRKHTT